MGGGAPYPSPPPLLCAGGYDREELVCGGCSVPAGAAAAECPKHGTTYIEYKCRCGMDV